jgi:DNA invertase Pin-like site-specific DNA recombinase
MADIVKTLVGGADADDPIATLNAITETRAELDRIEAVAVRRARNAGAPWQLIALALGVTRQAVHKRYGRK